MKLNVLVLFLFILKKKLQSKVFSAGIASQRPTVYKIRSLTIWIPNCWGLLTLTLTNCEEGIPPSNIPLPLYQQCNFCHPFIRIFFVLYCLHINSLRVGFILSEQTKRKRRYSNRCFFQAVISKVGGVFSLINGSVCILHSMCELSLLFSAFNCKDCRRS